MLVDRSIRLALPLLLIAAGWCGAQESISVAVVPFDGPDTTAQARALGRTMAEHLTSFFAQSGMLRVVERAQMEKLLSEVALGQSGLIDEEQALETGKMAGATHLTVGRYTPTLKGLSIQARIVEVESGTVVSSATVEGGGDRSTFDRLAVKLLAGVGIQCTYNRAYRVKRVLGFGGIGGAVLAGGLAIWSQAAYSAADEDYRTRYDLSAQEYADLYENAELHKSLRVYLAGTSVLLAAVAVYALVSNDAEWECARGDDAALRLVPLVGHRTAGMALSVPIGVRRDGLKGGSAQ
ncbi:MAG: hypothetical protein GF331_15140 [Chitinivibrionales bacterium]|nr:hypothetical protein [Chitinivibrionales bacterium]